MKKDWMISPSELEDIALTVMEETIDKSIVVTGCAGSGKSVLALQKAKLIQEQIKKESNRKIKDSDYEIIIFTKALCQYMETGREKLELNANTFFYHWQWKNSKNCPSADYVIVDEIQDFNEQEINSFVHAARKHFFFFGDTAQSVYDETRYGGVKPLTVEQTKQHLKNTGKDHKPFELRYNYRLPITVGRLVQDVGIDLPPFNPNVYKSKENEMPHVVKYATDYEQIKAIKRIIVNNDMNDVAILLPTNALVQEVKVLLERLEMNVEYKAYSDFTLDFSTENPKIMTYHSSKGLQFETVFIPWFERYCDEDERGNKFRKALYVAMTRTYKNLYIMYSGELPSTPRLDSNKYLTTEANKIEDIE